MSRKRAQQKLVSFSDNKNDLNRIKQEMNEGWAIISLVQNGNYYVGIMEKMQPVIQNADGDTPVFIPPRKKISISY